MNDSEGKTVRGAPFKPPAAGIWNGMVDAGRAFQQSRFDKGAPARNQPRPTDVVKVRNETGANRAKGEIVRIGDSVLTELDAESIWLQGLAITTECRFGVLLHPHVADEIDAAQVSGVCIALVNVTDESHTFATAVEGEYVLQSEAAGPAEILFKPEGTGTLECVVRFIGSSQHLVGVLDEELTSPTNGFTDPTTATMSIWERIPGTSAPVEYEDSGRNVELTNRDEFISGQAGDFVKAEFIGGEWQPYYLSCTGGA